MSAATRPDLLDCIANPTACGKCGVDADCMAPTPRCDVPTGRCVACLPTSDNCGGGMICVDADGFGKYECLGACRIDTDCIKLAGGGICCGGACRNTTNDVTNCGACGRVCAQYPNAANRCAGGTCSMGACNAGFLDCNKKDSDGCEVSASDDIANCGACGAVCPRIVGGTTVCSMGACSSSCNIGQLDCDNDLKNGCEADSTSDPRNCGKCGTACTAPAHAAAACDASKCSFRCQPHYFDCNYDTKDGCETDASQDLVNCGHCGNVCPPLPNATAACVNSLCTAGTCVNGFGDCDKKPGNGCETPLASDPNNCGACGNGCKSTNGSAVCAMGTCTLTCNMNYANCNNNTGDGCEANLQTDAKNCGSCGNVCPLNNPYCKAGVCGQVPPSPPACTTGSDIVSGATYVVCFADPNSAWIAATNGGGQYRALNICKQYNYTRLGRFGGTCGNVCAYCAGGFSCNAPQQNTTWDGGGTSCGVDQMYGQILCYTVQWECLP